LADTHDRRQRRPRRPTAYLIVAAASVVIALGSAWEAARPPGKIVVIWRGKPHFVRQGIGRDVGPAAP